MNNAALAGDVTGVLRESARLLANEVKATTVAVGLVRDGSITVETWTAKAGEISERHVRSVPVDSDHPLARAARSVQMVDLGPDHDGIALAVPICTIERAIGALGVGGHPSSDQALPQLTQIALRTALAAEHATLRGTSRYTLQETVSVLAALIEGRDTYTEQHCINLAEMSLAVGLRVGLSGDRLDRLTYGGLLHDIGKIAIPDSILNKPGVLTEREFEEMKTHAGVGEEILQRISSLAAVGPIVGQHHERFDGSGYPRGLKGEKIIFESRILAVVDAFDAMTTTRPYRPALSWTRAIEEISSASGAQFDPEVAEVFLRYLEGEEAQWRTASPT